MDISVIIGAAFVLFYVRIAWGQRKPENVKLGKPSGKYRFGALLWFSAAAFLVFLYLQDQEYWHLAGALLPASVGVATLSFSRHAELSETQRESLRRRMASEWWIGPVMLALLLGSIWPIVLFAPRWLAGLWVVTFPCAMSWHIIWQGRIPSEPEA